MEKKTTDDLRWYQRRRVHLCMALYLAFFISYCLQSNISIALVAMTNPKDNDNSTKAEFEWDNAIQGHILSSYFYGYIATQLLGGWMAARFGGRIMMAISVGMPSLLTILTPVATLAGAKGMIATRVLIGIFSGALFSTNHAIWSRWAPPHERGQLMSFANSGGPFGIIIMMLSGGIMADKLGWQSLFYVVGILGIIWSIFWIIISRNSPELDGRINPKECIYILENLEQTKGDIQNISHPFWDIAISPKIWAHIIINFANFWGFNVILSQIPTYFKDIRNLELATIGYLAALLHISEVIALPLSGWLSDWFIARGIFGITWARKIIVSIGFIGFAIFLCLILVVENAAGVVVCLALALFFNTTTFSVILVNPLDLAREHASVIWGFSNTFGSFGALVGSTITGYLTQDKTSLGWMYVFFIISALSIFGTLTFLIFGSGKRQPWAKGN